MRSIFSGGKKSVKGFLSSSKIETLIGLDTVIHGDLSSEGTIRIDGKVEGGIKNAFKVIVGKDGEVSGDIRASIVVIGGKAAGNISSQSLEILSSAHIQGDIKTSSLSIAEGSIFEGNCTMAKEKDIIEMDLASKNLKI